MKVAVDNNGNGFIKNKEVTDNDFKALALRIAV